MVARCTQRHTETWTGTDYANAVSDIVYGYNNMGELASVTVLKENGQTPTAVASSTQYDATGGTSTTTLPNTVYSYDLGGRLGTTLDSATGITTTYTYKPNTNYVQEVKTTNSVGTVLADDSYTYRADGLKTGATEYTLNSDGTSNTVTLSWTYDGLDRLATETSSDTAGAAALNYTHGYQYDLNSNRTLETITGAGADTITSTYNANNELAQTVDANAGTTTYTYDNNGSQTAVASPTGTTTNVYDLQGRLVAVTNKDANGNVTSSATYIYDDSGNRIGETTVTGTNSPVTTYFLVDTQTLTGYSQVVEESQTPGTPTRSYVWGLNLIAQDNAAGTANAGTCYFVVDGHGNTQALTDSNGNVAQTFHYDDFGGALGFTPSAAITQYLYTQEYFDLISNTYYVWARNYDPGTGSFTQADYGYSGSLTNPMTDLPYAFTGGDPINILDLNGHDFSLTDTLASFAINSIMTSAISNVVAPFAGDAAALLIPPSLLIALETAGAPDAVEFGVEGSAGGQYKGFGLSGAAGINLLVSTHTGNAALYGFVGGGFSLFGGGTGFSGGIGASVGLVWRTPHSSEFATAKQQISLPFGALPAGFREKVERDLAESTASSNFMTEVEARNSGWSSTEVDDYQWRVMKDAYQKIGWLTSRLNSLSVNIFSQLGNPTQDIGVSFSVDIFGNETEGVTSGVALGFTRAWQIAPEQPVYFG